MSELTEKVREKLEKDSKSKDGNAKLIIEYLLKRVEESEALAQDIMLEHKSFDRCYEFIVSKAKSQAKNGCAMIKDETVYEWAEDYFHLDDKELVEKENKEKEEKKKAADNKPKPEPEKEKTKSKPVEKPKAEPKKAEKQHKSSEQIEGQIDMFSFMAGMGGE